MTLDDSTRICGAAVDLINSGQLVNLVTLTATTGLRPADIVGCYRTVDAVYADIAHDLITTHRQAFTTSDITRRLSVRELITRNLATIWDTVTRQPAQHRAVQILQLTKPATTIAGPGGHPVTLARLTVVWSYRWLTQVGRIQAATWNTPVPLLARFAACTLNGLAGNQAHLKDRVDIEEVLATLAYQLARHATKDSAGKIVRAQTSRLPGPRLPFR